MAQLKDSIGNLISKAFNLQALTYSRWKWVDYLKGIAIVLVVYRHVLIGIERTGATVPGWIVNLNMIFFNFRMPLFFILAGLFIGGSLAKRSVGKLVNIKFQHLLYPYLVWAFIQISLQMLLSGSTTNSNRSWVDYTYIFYQPRALDQFWYLPALFFTSIIFVLLKTKLNTPFWVQLLLGMVFYFVAPYLDSISIVSDWMSFYIFFALGDALSAIFFQKSSQAFLKNKWSLVLLTPIFVLVQVYYLNSPISHIETAHTNNLELMGIGLIGCLYMFILAFHLEKWNILNFLRILGYHSLYIYVMHVIVQAFSRTVLTKYLGVDQPVVLLITGIAFGVIVPVIFYNLCKDNIGRFLFSPEKKQQPQQPKPVKQPDLIPQ